MCIISCWLSLTLVVCLVTVTDGEGCSSPPDNNPVSFSCHKPGCIAVFTDAISLSEHFDFDHTNITIGTPRK